MSTATAPTTNESEFTSVARDPRDMQDYRSVCSAAVTSFVIAVLGLSAFWLSGLLLIPIVGLLLGIYAWLTIRRRQDELTGSPLALASILLSVFTLATAGGFHAYVYATEVPDGYERISYRFLRTDRTIVNPPLPDSAVALDGKNVFIKGYMLDVLQPTGIKSFNLVRDKGDCCFGANPQVDERILVILDGQMVKYTDRGTTVVGEFVVLDEKAPDYDDRIERLLRKLEAAPHALKNEPPSKVAQSVCYVIYGNCLE